MNLLINFVEFCVGQMRESGPAGEMGSTGLPDQQGKWVRTFNQFI